MSNYIPQMKFPGGGDGDGDNNNGEDKDDDDDEDDEDDDDDCGGGGGGGGGGGDDGEDDNDLEWDISSHRHRITFGVWPLTDLQHVLQLLYLYEYIKVIAWFQGLIPAAVVLFLCSTLIHSLQLFVSSTSSCTILLWK